MVVSIDNEGSTRAQKSVAVMGMLRWARRHEIEEKIRSRSDVSERGREFKWCLLSKKLKLSPMVIQSCEKKTN